MTLNLPTSVLLLGLLHDAATTEDFLTVAETLKRMLQPWGMRLPADQQGQRDIFTEQDKDLLGEFWGRCLKPNPLEPDMQVRALPYYMIFAAAANEREYTYVISAAQNASFELAEICVEILATYSTSTTEETDRPNVVRFDSRQAIKK